MMPTLSEYTRLVEKTERGEFHPSLKSLERAIHFLVDRICSEPWETSEDRSRAQALIARLERLKHQLGQEHY